MQPSTTIPEEAAAAVPQQQQQAESRQPPGEDEVAQLAIDVPGRVADLQVRVGSRVLAFGAESQVSFARLMGDLAERLRVSGPASLQLSDVSGRRIKGELELREAISAGHTPLQGSLTAFALRDVETHRSEVEAEKGQLTHCQWQIIADKFTTFSSEIATVAADFQAVKDECHASIDRCHAEEAMQRDRLMALVDREAQARVDASGEVDRRFEALAERIVAESSARDVAVHQLKAQMQTVLQSLDDERALRAQEKAETVRALQAMEQTLEAECKRAEEHRQERGESGKRLEVRVDTCEAHDGATELEITRLNADSERTRASLTQLELAVAQQRRAFEESLQRRGDELSRAVREEVQGRENHLTRFSKNLEGFFQGVEAKIARAREEASNGLSAAEERARALERRCEQVEKDLTEHRDTASERVLAMSDKLERAWTLVDKVDMSVAASDAILQPTVKKVDDLYERLTATEEELQLRPRQDVVTTQCEELQRTCQKQGADLVRLERCTNARFASEAAQRENMKAQLKSSVQACLDKIAGAQSPAKSGAKSMELKTSASAEIKAGTTLPAKAIFHGLGEMGGPPDSGDREWRRPMAGSVHVVTAAGLSRGASPLAESVTETVRQASSPALGLASPSEPTVTLRQLPLSARSPRIMVTPTMQRSPRGTGAVGAGAGPVANRAVQSAPAVQLAQA